MTLLHSPLAHLNAHPDDTPLDDLWRANSIERVYTLPCDIEERTGREVPPGDVAHWRTVVMYAARWQNWRRKMADSTTIDYFIKVCAERGVTVIRSGDALTVGGSLYLTGCTGLTSLPEGLTVGDWLDLTGCTGLTSLPDALTVGGSLYLTGWKYLPAGTYTCELIYARAANGPQEWRGQPVMLRHIDGYTMVMGVSRQFGDIRVTHARYLRGHALADMPQCYVAEQEEHSAHGETIAKAIHDLRFKIAQENYDSSELVETIRERGTVRFDDFRLATGACAEGLRHGMQEAGLDPNAQELPLDVVLAKVHGPYGDQFRELFE